MKYCTYTYKGRKIGGVKELDDFLLEKKRYEAKLGDMVFSHSTRQLAALDKKAQVDKKKDELDRKYEEARKKAKQYGADEEAILKMERPYIGVSEFLTGQRNREGKLYFPEFVAQNYWANRYYEWAKGNFTDDEINLFFDGDKSKATPIPLGNDADWRDSAGVLKETFGTTEQERLRDLMQDKWEHQAKYGTELHNIL